MSKNIKLSCIYKTILSVLLLAGILARAGLFGDELKLETFYSFTTISNFFILIITFIAIYDAFHDRASSYKVRFLGVIMILVTGIVYHFILLPEKLIENPNYTVLTYGNIMAHYIAPCAFFMDWLLFDEKGKLTKKGLLLYTLVPISYFMITTLYGYISSLVSGKEVSYVYFFMDFNKLGVGGVFKWCSIILLAYMTLVYFIYFIDFLMGRVRKSNLQS